MKSLLLSLVLVCALATSSAADERVEAVKSQASGGQVGVSLLRCASGWVPASSNCPTDAPSAIPTPSPIPGPESLHAPALAPTEAPAPADASVTEAPATVETAPTDEPVTAETEPAPDEPADAPQSPQTSENQLTMR